MHPVAIVYRNHRREVFERIVDPKAIEFGVWPDHGPHPCWMLRAFCRTRQAERSFKLEDILEWRDAPKESFDWLLREWREGQINRACFEVEAAKLAGLEDIDDMIRQAACLPVGTVDLRPVFKEFKNDAHHYMTSAGTEHRYPDRAVAAILAWQGAQSESFT